jgi:hypothetical protein
MLNPPTHQQGGPSPWAGRPSAWFTQPSTSRAFSNAKPPISSEARYLYRLSCLAESTPLTWKASTAGWEGRSQGALGASKNVDRRVRGRARRRKQPLEGERLRAAALPTAEPAGWLPLPAPSAHHQLLCTSRPQKPEALEVAAVGQPPALLPAPVGLQHQKRTR